MPPSERAFNEPRVAINRVYTRHGDGGQTRLVGGQEVPKDDARIEAYGTVDELNAFLGVARHTLVEGLGAAPEGRRAALAALDATLVRVQHELFNLGSILATLPEDVHPRQPRVTSVEVAALEADMDRCQEELQPLRSFVLPGGCRLNADLHVARTVCRRAERHAVALARETSVDPEAVKYLNRLSDALFVWSRWASLLLGAPEVLVGAQPRRQRRARNRTRGHRVTSRVTSPLPARTALRAAGTAVGLFILVNLAGQALRPPFATLGAWISLPDPPLLGYALAAATAAVLLGGSRLPERSPRLRLAAGLLLGAVAAAALVDAALFYRALAHHAIRTPAVIPASLLVAALFAALALDLRRGPAPPLGPRGALATAAVLLALPLLRMLTFGPTRYDRPADCAVVFGARVWNDGTPSDALADRVDEAVGLYQRGLVKRLVMSGGVEPENGLEEAEVMRARAVAAGVPREAVLLDEAGVDTASTVRNTAALMRREGLGSALVVSHYYHEPRAKMLFDRAGVRAYTVPATMKRRLYKEPYFLAREVGAYWHSFVFE